jgi:hypothetical protein
MGPPPGSISAMEQEYTRLREDDRQWGVRATSLGSLYLLGVGTAAFFLLGEHPPKLPPVIALLIPIPAFGITALIVRQAITATARGVLLLAYERTLYKAAIPSVAPRIAWRGGVDSIPAVMSYHAQQPWLQGSEGKQLTWFERSGLVLVFSVCWLSVKALPNNGWAVCGIVVDSVAATWLLWLARDGFGAPAWLERCIGKRFRLVRTQRVRMEAKIATASGRVGQTS